MRTNHVIREYGRIYNSADFPDGKDRFDCIYLKSEAFESFKNLVCENNNDGNDIDIAFNYHKKKGVEYISVKNYVGIVETVQGVVIEILPKIFMAANDETAQVHFSKRILLRMLRSLKNSPFKTMNMAHLKTSRMPLIELFITLYLNEIDNVLQKGIKHHYTNITSNEKYLKGKLQIAKHIRHNLIHKEKFSINYDEFRVDIPQNRIIKSSLNYLSSRTRTSSNLSRIKNYLKLFDGVSDCMNLTRDLALIKSQNRLFNYYAQALNWAEVFLTGKSFTSYFGKNLNMAILFPMEVLFESYVTKQKRKEFPNAEISSQDRSHWLVKDFSNGKSINKFRLRPDIVIRENGCIRILDAKWKILDQDQPRKNYLISSSDMYQLFSYGKKYQHEKNGSVELELIYPLTSSFQKELNFQYEDELEMKVSAFDFMNNQ
jgi:5-methylcytosine-specific restriction enzyme subunit McrC